MDITSAKIKNSAESIIKNRNSIEKKDGSRNSHANKEDTVQFNTHLTGRYIILQNKLNTLQNEYTREQTRLSLLESNSVTDEEIVNILYGGTPLFTESLDEMIHEKSTILDRIKAQKAQIADQIRVLEIESENIFSVSTGGNLTDIPRVSISKDSLKPLDIKVVEKLIKG